MCRFHTAAAQKNLVGDARRRTLPTMKLDQADLACGITTSGAPFNRTPYSTGQAYFKRGETENPTFCGPRRGKPWFIAAHALDVGCRVGSLCGDMAAGGAVRVVGLETETRLREFAKQSTAAPARWPGANSYRGFLFR